MTGRRVDVEVLWRLDGATKTDRFQAGHYSVTMSDHGRTVVELEDGSDTDGPVLFSLYKEAYRVQVRPVPPSLAVPAQ